MKRGILIFIIIFIIIIVLLLLGLTYINNIKEDKAEIILYSTLNAISGENDFKSNTELPEDIKQYLINYQENNLISDDTTIVILDNVDYFNMQFKAFEIKKEREHFFNNLPPYLTDEEMEVYIEEHFNTNDFDEEIEIDERYISFFEESAIDIVDNRVIEKDNQYLIKLNDLEITENKGEIIYHKGAAKEINYDEIGKETYSMRQNNPKYKYYIVKTDNSFNKTTYICASEYDKHIIEIHIDFKFLTPYNVTIK